MWIPKQNSKIWFQCFLVSNNLIGRSVKKMYAYSGWVYLSIFKIFYNAIWKRFLTFCKSHNVYIMCWDSNYDFSPQIFFTKGTCMWKKLASAYILQYEKYLHKNFFTRFNLLTPNKTNSWQTHTFELFISFFEV